jgi:hypothetical protein
MHLNQLATTCVSWSMEEDYPLSLPVSSLKRPALEFLEGEENLNFAPLDDCNHNI